MKIVRRTLPAEIPTSSMADIAFLLIIFFLVASFYSVTRGIQFSLPKHDEAALTAEPEAAVLIEIESTGALLVDNKPMPLADIRGYIGPKLQQNPTKSVILQTSLEAPYQAMTDVFDELRQVGVQNLVIPTNSELQTYGLRQLR
jgi:biopolymer transport protein ExbD